MREGKYYVAMYGIIKNEKGEILMMRRANTGFMDGKYGLPAGHLEGKESVTEGAVREIKEEIGIMVPEDSIKLIHTSHRVSGERVYIDFYFEVSNYSGEIYNAEPHKCSEISYVQQGNPDIVPYLQEIFKFIEQGEVLSQFTS